ncbi:MAG: ATP-binding protein [Thermoguttaceae bacterium]
MYLERSMKDCWTRAGRQFPVLLLTGPRQVGKTTLLEHLREDGRRYVTLDDPTLRTLAVDDPALFLQRFEPPVLIDEIQYAPQLLPLVKMRVDAQRRPGMFWLTGSQQFQLMQGISETLAGRVAILNLLGLSSRERHRQELNVPPFLPTRAAVAEREGSAARSDLNSLYNDIWLGAFPSLTAGPIHDRDLFYSSYLQTYLQRDVKDLAQVGNEMAFVRFLRACAARTAQMLNLSELARDADVAVNTAKSWLSILQASFQVYLLQPYFSNLTRRLVKAPKLYFLDTGLAAYLTEWSSPETLAAGAMAGPMLETHVLCELLKSWWHRGKSPRLYYYRDRDGHEIDFLFLQDQVLHPAEVKKTASPRREMAQPLAAVSGLKQPVGEGVLLCLCPQTVPLTQDVDAVPVGVI